MSDVILPRLNQSGPNEWSDVEANDVAIREILNGELDHENLKSAANIAGSQLAEKTIEEKRLADAAVTSRKLKPTVGILYGTGEELLMNGAYQDVPGTTLSITPLVASKLKVWCIWEVVVNGAGEVGQGALGAINLDGARKTPEPNFGQGGATKIWVRIILAQNYLFSLTAAPHTLKLQVTGQNPSSVTPKGCSLMYELVAS